MKNVFLITIIIISTLTSCNIQKKRYSRGFTISKNRNYISSVKKKKDIKTNQNSEISKISPPRISKVNQEPLNNNIVIENKIELASKNIEKLEIVDIYQSEKKEEISSKLTANSKSKQFENFTIKRIKTIKKTAPDTNKKPINNYALIALIFIIIPLIGFIIGFILGFKALKQIKSRPKAYRKVSKTLAIIAIIPFYIILLTFLIMSIFLVLNYGLLALILIAILLTIIISPIYALSQTKTIKETTEPEEKPKFDEKPKTVNEISKPKKTKKSLSKNNKLLIFFILLFSSMLLIPLTLN